jgi:SAM-dependent methyltransferase
MLSQVTGLGMNIDELQSNARLTDYLIHDLNRSPELPFDSEAYDAVVCTVSVEYLTHPVAVFEEIGRVLSPGGLFLVTFSNRWFPPKVVKIWQDIHEFERMGLVIEYFNASGRFENLSTLSIRGYPRPETDKYFGQLFYSDPVYAVWGHRIAR